MTARDQYQKLAKHHMIGEINNGNVAAVMFGEYADKVQKLARLGVFAMQSGTVTLHFDAEGNIRKVEKHFFYNVT